MTWLILTKVTPGIGTGQHPRHDYFGPADDRQAEGVGWSIEWRGRVVGWAAHQVSKGENGEGRVTSLVHFQNVPWNDLLRDFFGPLANLVPTEPPDRQQGVEPVRVLTKMRSDRSGKLLGFDSTIYVAGDERLLQIEATVGRSELHFVARAGDLLAAGARVGGELYRGSIDLPNENLIADATAPLPRMTNLEIGQSWKLKAFQPLSFGSPVQPIEARVEGQSFISWNGAMRDVFHVVFRADRGSAISAAREPLSELWVGDGGVVLKQRLRILNTTVDFIRLQRVPEAFEELR